MDTRHGKTVLFIVMDGLFILAMVFAVTAPVHAATTSPFTGEWFATDIDGGVIRRRRALRPRRGRCEHPKQQPDPE